MEHPILDGLEKIKSAERVVEISRSADKTPEIIPVLLNACKSPKPKNRAFKAAWVLHHIHNRYPHLIEPYAEDLLDVLDHTEVKLERNYIEHDEISAGGELRFFLGPNPSVTQ